MADQQSPAPPAPAAPAAPAAKAPAKAPGPPKRLREVVIVPYCKLLFMWPVIAVGFLCAILMNLSSNPELAVSLTWLWIGTLCFGLMVALVDFNREWFIIIVVFSALVIFVMLFFREKGWPLFSNLANLVALIRPTVSPRALLVISSLLGASYLLMLGVTRLFSKWRFTNNEFEHISFGKRDVSIARAAKTVVTAYPDYFELFTCLAGDLIILNPQGNQEIRRITGIPLLPFKKKRLDALLERLAVDPRLSGLVEDEEDSGGGGTPV